MLGYRACECFAYQLSPAWRFHNGNRCTAALLPAPAAFFLPQHPEWQAQIVLPDELQPPCKAHTLDCLGWPIPAVDPGAAEPAVAATGEMPMQAQILHHVLDQQQAGPPARQVEAVQHLDVVAFHVDRDEIERARRTGVDQHLVE